MSSLLFGYSTFMFSPVICLVYIAAAVLPAAWLLHYIWKNDTWEKEPPELLLSLLLRSVISVIIAVVLEVLFGYIMEAMVDYVKIQYDYAYYTRMCIGEAVMVGFVEEFAKDIVLYKRTWNDPNFNYRFDAIVYSAFVSLGFAALENIKYVFSYGLSVSLSRALLAIPGHLSFSVLFGFFYGRAKHASNQGDEKTAKMDIAIGYLTAVAAHAFYDACAMINSTPSMIVFFVFIILLYYGISRLVRRESKTNVPV